MDPLQGRVSAALGELYELDAEIGRGGMAVVYSARDVRLRRRVAVKVLPPDLAFRPDVKSRFLREAQTAAQLNHPHIVPIFSVDERDGLVYFVMTLVDGESLAATLAREARPPLERVRRILRETADALAYAHAHGVVHRDVKPDNILLEKESGRVLVTDFGIARAAEAESRLTVTGIAVGTPTYMSPEQALGEKEVDGRSDIYSLGVVGYQMLAGETPFRATNTPSMLMKHLSEAPRPLKGFRPDLPDDLVVAIERALAKKPEDRWSLAGEMRDAIGGHGGATFGAVRHPATSRNGEPASAAPAAMAPPPMPSAPTPAPPPAAPPAPEAPEAAPPLDPHAIPLPRQPGRALTDSREEIHRQWREASRQWREQVGAAQQRGRDQIESRVAAVESRRQEIEDRVAARRESFHQPHPREPTRFDDPNVERRIRSFRRQLWGSSATVGFLAAINIATSPGRPWFLLPAAGLALNVVYRAGSLWADGVGLTELLGDVRHDAPAGVPQSVYERVHAFRRRLKLTAFWGGASAVSFAIGAGFNADPMIPVFLLSCAATVGNFVAATLNVRGLHRVGLKVRDALGSGWRTKFRLPPGFDPAPAGAPHMAASARPLALAAPSADRVSAEAARLAPVETLNGPYGTTIRRAVADREAINEIVNKLGRTDREMLPEVAPTVAALLERIVSLASALHRLDGDATPEALSRLDARIASVEREPASTPDRDRKLALLQRQRATLGDLVKRRDTLLSQMESASLVLQNLKLDLLKLRSSGVQASIEEVSTATQEARALSREIGHVLDAAAQIRSI